MMTNPLHRFAKRGAAELKAQGFRLAETLGLHDPSFPRSYRQEAPPLGALPVPRLPSPSRFADALDAGLDEALGGTGVSASGGGWSALMGLPLSRENVEAVLDEQVRPALNADGGDIELVKIEDGNVFVRLVGACNSCPSSVVTMRMGVERMLQDEFPDMDELIQVA